VLARHPVKERFDAFWIVGGRLVDWGPLPGDSELVVRTTGALARPPGRSVIPTDEVDEIRIVAAWTAEHEPAAIDLEPAPDAEAVRSFAASAVTTEPVPVRVPA